MNLLNLSERFAICPNDSDPSVVRHFGIDPAWVDAPEDAEPTFSFRILDDRRASAVEAFIESDPCYMAGGIVLSISGSGGCGAIRITKEQALSLLQQSEAFNVAFGPSSSSLFLTLRQNFSAD